ncbi:MAG: hypothetical protein PHW95_05395, partial [Patescibacteria group bacterium]|nr:hypothetical protein [Patescibacteria group bacterium]
VGVRPSAINAVVTFGTNYQTQFLVVNVTNEPANYTVYPTDHQKQITLQPADFVLGPRESKLVDLSIHSYWPSHWQTYLAVVSRPMSAGSIDAVSGIKLPLQVSTVVSPINWLMLAILITGCLGFLIVILLKMKGEKYEVNR